MNSRGSVWNKWDLHIHTPYSICNKYGGDNDDTWERFITCLENLPKEVKVIGINDYYFIDGFEKVMEYKTKGRLSNIEKIFPVLEFRIDTFASATETKFQKVNYHILFDVDSSNWKQEVKKIKEEFIGLIKLSKLPEHTTKILSKENFTKVAGSLQEGFNSIIPNKEEVINYVNSDTWKDKTFIFIGYKEWSNLDKRQQLKPYKENIFDVADAFFTASESDNIENKKKIINDFGDKPIIHSSDIHSFDLFGDNYKCFTWIKSKCTFQGLKQILFEQNERLRIQESNPEYDEPKQLVIDSIKIENSNRWFSSEELSLNRGLVSIIGEKGAGKTALLDILAVSNDEGIYEQDIKNPYSFYNRAKKLLKGTKVSIRNVGSEEVNEYIVNGEEVDNESNEFGKVRYLSLKELESYCDNKEKLQKFIKNIVFNKKPEAKMYENDSKDIVKKIQDTNIKIVELIEEMIKYDDIVKQLTMKKKELEVKCNNKPEVRTSFTEEQAKEYQKAVAKRQEIKSENINLEKEYERIDCLKRWITNKLMEEEKELNDELSEKLKDIDINICDEISKMKFKIGVSNGNSIDKFFEVIKTKQEEIKKENVKLQIIIEPLEELNANYKNESEIIKKWIENKNELENEIHDLEKQVKLFDELKEREKLLKQRRQELIYKLLNNKIEQKNKYYELKSELETDKNIEFEVNITVNKEEILRRESEIINHGMGNSVEVIKKKLQNQYIDKIDNLSDITKNDVLKFFDEINITNFIKEVFGMNREYKNLMKKGYNIINFYNLIFSDYYQVNYSIRFKDRSLQSLSPGQKGLVLMKIFLKLDNSNKPLLIDQPEDNLDNKSVYKDLVNDLKESKKKRQIIIATHNPNLVINTDSEQVIVAKFEDSLMGEGTKIQYKSGALEDKEIRESVCDILEGGDIAFIKREQRYNMSKRK